MYYYHFLVHFPIVNLILSLNCSITCLNKNIKKIYFTYHVQVSKVDDDKEVVTVGRRHPLNSVCPFLVKYKIQDASMDMNGICYTLVKVKFLK